MVEYVMSKLVIYVFIYGSSYPETQGSIQPNAYNLIGKQREIVAEGKRREAIVTADTEEQEEEEEGEAEDEDEEIAYKVAQQLLTQVDENLQNLQKISDELLAK